MFLISPRPPSSTLFPYTTLFRSIAHDEPASVKVDDGGQRRAAGGPPRAANLHARGRRRRGAARNRLPSRSEEHTSELQSHVNLVCRLLLEKKKKTLMHY